MKSSTKKNEENFIPNLLFAHLRLSFSLLLVYLLVLLFYLFSSPFLLFVIPVSLIRLLLLLNYEYFVCVWFGSSFTFLLSRRRLKKTETNRRNEEKIEETEIKLKEYSWIFRPFFMTVRNLRACVDCRLFMNTINEPVVEIHVTVHVHVNV